jgi:hypothetical protein
MLNLFELVLIKLYAKKAQNSHTSQFQMDKIKLFIIQKLPFD